MPPPRTILLLWCLLAWAGLAGITRAFLATPLDMTHPDVANILCPSEMTEESRDHEWITREGIRRNIRDFFLANPPRPGFLLPADASLTELFHEYFSPTASPTRFIKAVNSVATANVKTDSEFQYRYDPSIHGDGEQLDAVHAKLQYRYPQIITSIMVEEAYAAARSLLGTSFHSLQKFYSHSTWIELGNTEILEELGVPGSSLGGMMAGETEDVCTSCATSYGECSGNVIVGGGLSSGYYMYPSEIGGSQLIPKPTTGGKCSHGGSLDMTASELAIGGINKDTSSPCFSPHHRLHAQAAELAIQATDYYLNKVLRAVGPDKYRRLFDLYQGTALSMSIDTTGSMGDDIDAVKDQVHQIVENTETELYILSQFNDPSCGPVFKTSDADEFLAAVDSLTASGGLGDGPELFWCGLQNALGETPNYGDVFCFTDAGGKDGELMDAVIALAQNQNNKVTVIVSDLLRRDSNKLEEKHDDDDNVDNERNLITGTDEYKRLTEATGGLFINSAKFDINDIVTIIGSAVETSTATIMSVEVDAALNTEVPVDDSVVDCELHIVGELNTALFTDPAGTKYDLMDRAGLEAAGVEVISYTPDFKAVKWPAPVYGMWVLNTTLAAGTTSHSVTLIATTTLDFLADFSFLDPSPPHPHYRPIEGQPLLNTIYYLEVTLVGHLESKVAVVNEAQYVDKTGVVERETPYPMAPQDQAYLRSEALPDHPFFVKLEGYLESGNLWTRLSPVEIWPVETKVDLYATTDDLSARPGESASALFLVTNYGVESYFTISAIDDLHFVVAVVPDRVLLVHNGTVSVEVQFMVPLDATHGQVSTTIVTTRSETQTQSANSALAHFIVLAKEVDEQPPTCILINVPDCTGYLTNGICGGLNWTAQAIFKDSGSGLYDVHAEPTGFGLTLTGLTTGTTEEVLGDYLASCCTTQASLYATDGQGNVCETPIDLGKLGGLIENFSVNTSTAQMILLQWTITDHDIPLSHYEITANDAFTSQNPCQDSSCIQLMNYLEPCSHHHFAIAPVFQVDTGEKVTGYSAYTEGTTMDGGDPETPTNGREIDATETTITIAWDPDNEVCPYTYEVCYYEVNTDPGAAKCDSTSGTSITIRDLVPCKAYFIDVLSTSDTSGNTALPLSIYSVTLCTEIPH